MSMIWILEDDEKIGRLIEMAMRKAGHEALRLLDDVQLDAARKKEPLPALLLLDLMLRAKSGFTVLEEWRARRETKEIPVIILSARSAEVDKVRGLELGADDYVTKPFGVRELQARVAAALRRAPAVPDVLHLGALTVDLRAHEVRVSGQSVDVTKKEFELLCYLVRHPGETVSRGTLLREVWGYATENDPSRTVDSHIKTLRMKLGDNSEAPRFLMTVRGQGYKLIAEEQA